MNNKKSYIGEQDSNSHQLDVSLNPVFLAAIAGSSGSGKSEICRRLMKIFPNTLLLSLDDYFDDPENLPKVGEWKNSDVPEAIKFDLLAEDLRALKNGQSITVSVLAHPHENWERTAKTFQPVPFVILEGFLALYDKAVRHMCDLKIFIDVPEELQFQRRMGRDREPDEAYIRQVVVPNYKIYGLPTKRFAEYVIDGSRPIQDVFEEVRRIVIKNYGESRTKNSKN